MERGATSLSFSIALGALSPNNPLQHTHGSPPSPPGTIGGLEQEDSSTKHHSALSPSGLPHVPPNSSPAKAHLRRHWQPLLVVSGDGVQ